MAQALHLPLPLLWENHPPQGYLSFLPVYLFLVGVSTVIRRRGEVTARFITKNTSILKKIMTFLQNWAVKEPKLLRGLRGCRCANVSSGLKAAKSFARELLWCTGDAWKNHPVFAGIPCAPTALPAALITSERDRKAKKGMGVGAHGARGKASTGGEAEEREMSAWKRKNNPRELWGRSSFPLTHKAQKLGSRCNWKATG